jgi:hypothetical protein
VAFTSNGKDGRRWVTWDYPLTYGLVMPPNTAVYRALHCQDVAELYQAHLDFLEVNDVRPDDLVAGERTREAARARLEETLNQQIEYNISRGYLAPVKGPDEENFCYSWRGTLYVAGQVLRDLQVQDGHAVVHVDHLADRIVLREGKGGVVEGRAGRHVCRRGVRREEIGRPGVKPRFFASVMKIGRRRSAGGGVGLQGDGEIGAFSPSASLAAAFSASGNLAWSGVS